MKGDVTINTIGLIVMAAVTLTLFFVFLPKIIDMLWKELALHSPSVVSKELSGYISISGAAPDSITISYYPSNLPYDVEIENRIASVWMSAEAKGTMERTPAKGTFPIDPIGSFSEVNSFSISKSDGQYEVDATWIERG